MTGTKKKRNSPLVCMSNIYPYNRAMYKNQLSAPLCADLLLNIK